MMNNKTTVNHLIDKIINIIEVEKGLSQNTKSAYTSDINLMNDWFKKQNIDLLNASCVSVAKPLPSTFLNKLYD